MRYPESGVWVIGPDTTFLMPASDHDGIRSSASSRHAATWSMSGGVRWKSSFQSMPSTP